MSLLVLTALTDTKGHQNDAECLDCPKTFIWVFDAIKHRNLTGHELDWKLK